MISKNFNTAYALILMYTFKNCQRYFLDEKKYYKCVNVHKKF